ncbi:MAG: UBP-type zinc finger domain-containing protein [Propionibacteriaceae bacterium]|nr:UBP-type zinc finger domain-containing protein [Propionibacteriaceae bacterium]
MGYVDRNEGGPVTNGIDTSVAPSGPGCVECDQTGGWWFHLRRCAQCGHVGCCDTSPNQHATKHFHTTGHPVMQSYEPRENWFWDFTANRAFAGPKLAEPRSHPADQAIPGPAGRVPADWESQLNE